MTISAAAIESVARPFGPDIWTVEGDPVRLLTIPFTTRMTIVRLPGGGLWMHSPVAPARARALAIGALGELRHVVAPNRFHNLFVGPWLEEHPDATSWAGPGLAERCPQLRVDHVLTDEAPAAWREVIDQVVFRGSRFIEEVMFVHRPSRTLIVTDLIQNLTPRARAGSGAGSSAGTGSWRPAAGCPATGGRRSATARPRGARSRGCSSGTSIA